MNGGIKHGNKRPQPQIIAEEKVAQLIVTSPTQTGPLDEAASRIGRLAFRAERRRKSMR